MAPPPKTRRAVTFEHPTGSCRLPDWQTARILRAGSKDWCEENRLLDPDNPEAEKFLTALDPGLFSTLVYPGAGRTMAQLLSNFMTWWFLLDDNLETVYNHKEIGEVAPYVPGMGNTAPSDKRTVFTDCAHKLSLRLNSETDASWQKNFDCAMNDWLRKGVREELYYRGKRFGISVDQYLRIRHYSSGAIPTLLLSELCLTEEKRLIPPPPLTAPLLNQAARIIFLGNDLFSHAKERNDRAPFNLVSIITEQNGGKTGQALDECTLLHNRAVEKYQRIREELWTISQNRAWLTGIDEVLSGLISWQALVDRYNVSN